MDWVLLALIASAIVLTVVVAVLVNLLTSARLSGSVVAGLVVAALFSVAVQYALETRDNKRPSSSDDSGATGQPSTPPMSHPTDTSTSASPAQSTPKTESPPSSPSSEEPQSSSTPSPTPDPQATTKDEPVAPPTILDYTRLAQMESGSHVTKFCATVYVPSPHSGTLFFAADLGTFSPASFGVRGRQKRCTTYTAPSAPGVTEDRLVVRVIDNDSNKSVDAPEQVPISEPAEPPL
jgi:hypothetical protein